MPEPTVTVKGTEPPKQQTSVSVSPTIQASHQDTTPTQTSPAPQPKVTASDLVKRASQLASSSPDSGSKEQPQRKLTREEVLATITDPVQKEAFEQKWKAFDADISREYQRLNDERKKLTEPWTPDRVNNLLSDPNFVQSANAIIETRARSQAPPTWEGTTDEWSALNETEKAAFRAVQKKVDENSQQVNQLTQMHQQMLHQQEHESLKTQYSDYNPQAIDSFMQDVINNRISSVQLKELVHKGLNFDRYVENSYQFGLQDRNGNLQEKIQGVTGVTGVTHVTSADQADKPKMEQGERTATFFKRLAAWNLSHKPRTS